jgi:hypothetical protein
MSEGTLENPAEGTYELLADLVVIALLKRLRSSDQRRFAIILLTALVRDGKLAELLFVPQKAEE